VGIGISVSGRLSGCGGGGGCCAAATRGEPDLVCCWILLPLLARFLLFSFGSVWRGFSPRSDTPESSQATGGGEDEASRALESGEDVPATDDERK
jgi:hypothetical protein